MNNTALRAWAQSANNTHMVFAYEQNKKFYHEKLKQAGGYITDRQADSCFGAWVCRTLGRIIRDTAGNVSLWGSSLRKGRGNVLKIRLIYGLKY